ncbi:hypothetical protein ACFSBF_14140 [Sphingobacterium suaedae]|uniref:Uncharacterized protein n=1 Tax=Sphingobacterium suaedae TaxID=1686402 RepID=A0ABW5KHF7_9SPHI
MRILKMVRSHLIQQFSKVEGSVIGGVFVRPKPDKVRLDVIEINTIGLKCRKGSNVIGYLNVNYQDTSRSKVQEYTEFIDHLLSQCVINTNLFELDLQQIYPISQHLWLGNNMYKLTKI